MQEELDPNEWICPFPKCSYHLRAATPHSREIWRDLHLGNHKREQFLAERGIANNAPPANTESPRLEVPKKTPADYEKLELSVFDKGFFKTRGVKID